MRLMDELMLLGAFDKAELSPSAKKHKKEYDTKYESTPARKKYRRELEAERRKRGVDGKGGKDMSHTVRGTIVPEDMHANRARHFKSKGTLKKIYAPDDRPKKKTGEDDDTPPPAKPRTDFQAEYEELMEDRDHPVFNVPVSFDEQGNPIPPKYKPQDIDIGNICRFRCGGKKVHRHDGAIGCTNSWCAANTPEEMMESSEGRPQGERERDGTMMVEVGKVTPTRTTTERIDTEPGKGLIDLLPGLNDPNKPPFEPHLYVNVPQSQRIGQRVDTQGNPVTDFTDMYHPDLRTGEPMDIAMRLLKSPQMNLSGHSAECELCGGMMNAQEASVSNQQMGVSVCTPCLMREQQEINQQRDDDMMYRSESVIVNKNLNRWFKEKWVDVSRTGKDGKHPPCGRSKAKTSSKGYPKCRPSVKVSSKTPKTSGSMTSGQKRAATKRKRSKRQGVGGKPTIVKILTTEKPQQVQMDSGHDQCCETARQSLISILQQEAEMQRQGGASDDVQQQEIQRIENMDCDQLQQYLENEEGTIGQQEAAIFQQWQTCAEQSNIGGAMVKILKNEDPNQKRLFVQGQKTLDGQPAFSPTDFVAQQQRREAAKKEAEAKQARANAQIAHEAMTNEERNAAFRAKQAQAKQAREANRKRVAVKNKMPIGYFKPTEEE